MGSKIPGLTTSPTSQGFAGDPSIARRPSLKEMRGAGLEPARYFYHEPLKLACLPFHHPRIRGHAIRRVSRLAGPESYLAGVAGGAAGFVTGADEDGAIGIEFSGTFNGAAWTGTGILRPSKILPLIRLVEEYAKNNDVSANSRANVHVNRKSGLAAPPAPKTVWLEPPKTAPTSAPLPCCNSTTIVSATQTTI